MMDAEQQYVIKVQRDRATSLPSDWQDRLAEMEGVTVIGRSSAQSAQFVATASGLEKVQKAFSDTCYIEPVQKRNT